MTSNSLMGKYLFYFLGVTLGCGLSAGCAWIEPWFTPTPPPVAVIERVALPRKIETSLPTPSIVTALTAEAASALQSAEAQVVAARKMRTLWPTAVTELEKARAAAQRLDSTSTIAFAREVIALCALSLEQRKASRVTP